MSAPATSLARCLRAAFGALLVCATGSGVGGGAGEPAAPAAAAAPFETRPAFLASGAGVQAHPAADRRSAAALPAPALPADPPPFAPGGDDLLAIDEAPAAPAAAPPTPTVLAVAPSRAPVTARIPVPVLPDPTEDQGDDWVAGDFFGDGRRALFRWHVEHGGAVRARFSAADGRAGLLADDDARVPCRAPGRPLAADFNGDGRPDVLLPCGAAHAHPVLYLSQPGGGYARHVLAAAVQSLQALAADVDGDGRLDIVTTDTTDGAWRPLWLRGRGDGSFE